jgi:hypothetical protein
VIDGGDVIVDDYFSCFGCKRAVDEFLLERGLRSRLVPDGRGGCSLQKLAPHASASVAVAARQKAA